MTAKELIEILEAFPPDSKVEVWDAYDDNRTEAVFVSPKKPEQFRGSVLIAST